MHIGTIGQEIQSSHDFLWYPAMQSKGFPCSLSKKKMPLTILGDSSQNMVATSLFQLLATEQG